ncbi:MAG: hypothetical protein RM347_020830 [Nostoc sp. ChiQUE02]|uniref:hypothetical protein n=1 Tax=Nostoc sp. ChiQUE02 TaxID=3075377 RepID=UPI002AD3D966|nr:hypothetical protein [Nostoc sp. ChiQUE02]MDZ8233290.1 hypothetical protein [Nostoc sp. ChiQUE02]
MKKLKPQVFLGLTGAFLAVGYSSLLAREIPIQSRSNLRKDLLAPSETNPNVNEYLEKNKPASYKALKRQLDAAIEDAKRPREEKVVKNLWSLSKSNSRVKSRENGGQVEYLMASWKYVKNPTEDWKIGTKKNIENQTWLTAVPQVKEFCENCKGIGINIPGNIMLALRLQQYLGLILNRNSNKTHFVEMWVKAEDLSRPCIDPEINDSTCNVLPIPVPASYPVLNQIYSASYTVGSQEHYPWTGLGYTYDWGNPKKPREGASEFLINGTKEKPIEVEVVSVTATKEYCNNQYLTVKD